MFYVYFVKSVGPARWYQELRSGNALRFYCNSF